MQKHKSSAKRPTIRDVAKLAGVSHMTVSRVLQKSGKVKKATVQRVLQAVKQLDYRPDPALSALAAYRTQGAIKPDGSVMAFLDCDGTEYSQRVLNGVKEEALIHGYKVELHRLPSTPNKQRQLDREFYHRGIRGLLFGPSDKEQSLEGWRWEEFAAVSLGALPHTPMLHAVASNYFQGAYSACRMLREAGIERIGLALEPKSEARTGHHWLGGYVAGMLDGKQVIFDETTLTATSFKKWCKRNRLQAVLTIHAGLIKDWPASPETFMVLNDTGPSTHTNTPWISLDPTEIGAEGVRMLHHLLIHREYGVPQKPKLVSISGVWITKPTELES